MSPQSGRGPGHGTGWAHLRRWLPALAVVGAVFVLAAAVYVPLTLTSTSSYCTSCHQMKAAEATWRHSLHSRADCVSCHVDPGARNAIAWRLQESKNIWATYLNVSANGMAKQVHPPSNAACEQCHDVRALGRVFGDIKFPHQSHVEMRGLTCIDCHRDVGHTAGDSTTVRMATCYMCHNGDAALGRCTLCHVTAPPAEVHPPDYLAAHGAFALQNEEQCLRCHHDKAAFCDACHAQPTPDHYSGTWRYTHGPVAAADTAGCLGCHDERSFCQQCHEVDHPSDWVDTHGETAAKGTESCLVCHPQTMCVECHEQRGIPAP